MTRLSQVEDGELACSVEDGDRRELSRDSVQIRGATATAATAFADVGGRLSPNTTKFSLESHPHDNPQRGQYTPHFLCFKHWNLSPRQLMIYPTRVRVQPLKLSQPNTIQPHAVAGWVHRRSQVYTRQASCEKVVES